MRIAVTAITLLFALAACSVNDPSVSPYQQPNSLMSSEINQRIDQIAFQHREELVQNLLWLTQAGEQTIPALLTGLQSDNAKVRSSCCWVLGRLRDRRTVSKLRDLISDSESSVSLEAARALVLMGDLEPTPKLIEGLDSDRKEVRYMCHEALKSATGHDFGYDHLTPENHDLQLAVLRWRQWWGEYSGDTLFATSYEQANGLGGLAAPGGETKSSAQSSDGTHDAAPQGGQPAPGTSSSESTLPGESSAPAVIPAAPEGPINTEAGGERATSEASPPGSAGVTAQCPELMEITFNPQEGSGTLTGKVSFFFCYETSNGASSDAAQAAACEMIQANWAAARDATSQRLAKSGAQQFATQAGMDGIEKALIEILNTSIFAGGAPGTAVVDIVWHEVAVQ